MVLKFLVCELVLNNEHEVSNNIPHLKEV